jgi:hypothetical protein
VGGMVANNGNQMEVTMPEYTDNISRLQEQYEEDIIDADELLKGIGCILNKELERAIATYESQEVKQQKLKAQNFREKLQQLNR